MRSGRPAGEDRGDALACEGEDVLEDGVVFRHSSDEFLLTAAQPNAGYLSSLIGGLDVEVLDVLGGFLVFGDVVAAAASKIEPATGHALRKFLLEQRHVGAGKVISGEDQH